VDIQKSILVPYPAERMFDLIEAAERYPAFLPWCAGATILERDESVVRAIIAIDWRGVRFSLKTRNPKRRPEWMAIHLEDGPFRRFDGEWRLRPLSTAGCRIDFRLGYDFDGAVMRLARPVFDRIADTLVDAFVARADREPSRTATTRAAADIAAGPPIAAHPDFPTPGG
jgi:ribosome-associated toxin RatA of RatAB toxin-antitoxin module